MPELTPLPPEGFLRTPWKNGGGVSIDIAAAYRDGAAPGGWSGVLWRFGRTAITVGAPFSDLRGYERLQLVVAGSGLVLETPEGEIDLRRPLRPVRYDGATPIVSRLENGPVEVVNLIADRTRYAIDMSVPEAASPLPLAAGTHLLYAPHGAGAIIVEGQAVAIAAGHALRIAAPAPPDLAVTAGTLVLASIRPLAA